MANKTYSELLRDPRWQRKRLEIMQRDGFACVNCNDETKNLQVHHRTYIYGRKPWEYDNDNLVTLCEDCHVREGFRLIRIDISEDVFESEWSVWFRVNDGILRLDANNGAYSWFEPDKNKPNARVSRVCLEEDFPSGNLSRDQQRRLAKLAVKSLLDNLKARR